MKSIGGLRQYFSKGTDLCRHNPDDLATVTAALNSRLTRHPAEVLDTSYTPVNKLMLPRPLSLASTLPTAARWRRVTDHILSAHFCDRD
jgi:hypothetical protein